MTVRKFTMAAAALALCMPMAAWAAKPGNQGQSTHHGQSAQGQSAHQDHGGQRQSSTTRARRQMGCPPGLAKRHNGCVPPGQWRRGDRLPASWGGHYVRYSQLPYSYRSQNRYDSSNRYIYSNNRVFVVDAATRVIERVFGL